MACIRLPLLSRAAAEAALAQLWCRLEEHRLPTPTLDVAFGNDDAVQIALLFADTAQANWVFHCWAREVGQVGKPTPERESSAV